MEEKKITHMAVTMIWGKTIKTTKELSQESPPHQVHVIEYRLEKLCHPSCLSLLNPLSSRLLIKSYFLWRLIYQAILSLSKLLFPSTFKSTSMENCCMTCSLVCSLSDSFVFIIVMDRSITGMPTMYVIPQPTN